MRGRLRQNCSSIVRGRRHDVERHLRRRGRPIPTARTERRPNSDRLPGLLGKDPARARSRPFRSRHSQEDLLDLGDDGHGTSAPWRSFRSRGRGRSILTPRTIWPGRGEITTTSSDSCTASSMLWVTKITVSRRFHQPLEIAAQLLAGHRVERAQRLVHQDQRRIVDQRAAEGGPLLHAAGQLIGMPVAGNPRARPRRASRAPGLIVVPAQPAHLDLQQHVAEHVAPVDQHVALEDDADVGVRPAYLRPRPDLARCRRADRRRSSAAACSCRSPTGRPARRSGRARSRDRRAEGVDAPGPAAIDLADAGIRRQRSRRRLGSDNGPIRPATPAPPRRIRRAGTNSLV